MWRLFLAVSHLLRTVFIRAWLKCYLCTIEWEISGIVSGTFVMLQLFLSLSGRPNENECFPAAKTKRERMGNKDESDPAVRLVVSGTREKTRENFITLSINDSLVCKMRGK